MIVNVSSSRIDEMVMRVVGISVVLSVPSYPLLVLVQTCILGLFGLASVFDDIVIRILYMGLGSSVLTTPMVGARYLVNTARRTMYLQTDPMVDLGS
jgi:hypothetical protein